MRSRISKKGFVRLSVCPSLRSSVHLSVCLNCFRKSSAWTHLMSVLPRLGMTYRWMDWLVNVGTDGRTDGQSNRRTVKQTDKHVFSLTASTEFSGRWNDKPQNYSEMQYIFSFIGNGQTDRQTDGQMDGRTNPALCISEHILKQAYQRNLECFMHEKAVYWAALKLADLRGKS